MLPSLAGLTTRAPTGVRRGAARGDPFGPSRPRSSAAAPDDESDDEYEYESLRERAARKELWRLLVLPRGNRPKVNRQWLEGLRTEPLTNELYNAWIAEVLKVLREEEDLRECRGRCTSVLYALAENVDVRFNEDRAAEVEELKKRYDAALDAQSEKRKWARSKRNGKKPVRLPRQPYQLFGNGSDSDDDHRHYPSSPEPDTPPPEEDTPPPDTEMLMIARRRAIRHRIVYYVWGEQYGDALQLMAMVEKYADTHPNEGPLGNLLVPEMASKWEEIKENLATMLGAEAGRSFASHQTPTAAYPESDLANETQRILTLRG